MLATLPFPFPLPGAAPAPGPGAGALPDGLAPTPRDAVWSRGPVTLFRYRRAPGDAPAPAPAPAGAEPVLLVPSIINRSYVFDLRRGQSVVAALLAAGLDVWLVDWGTPAQADAHLGLDDYALRLLDGCTAAVRAATGAARVHLFGYCLGGTFALIHAARRPEVVRSVVALTTPVDLSEPGAMGPLTDARLVDLERIARAFPVVPGPALWATFQALDPVGGAAKVRALAQAGLPEPGQAEADPATRERAARLRAQEAWLADPVPMTARALRAVVGDLYRENALARGRLVLDGAPVDLAAGRCPVLVAQAQGDTIVPLAASAALAGLWGGPVEAHALPGGHVGVTVGSRAPQGLWALATRWLSRPPGAFAPAAPVHQTPAPAQEVPRA